MDFISFCIAFGDYIVGEERKKINTLQDIESTVKKIIQIFDFLGELCYHM
jgi:hypothetical protein